MMRAGRSLPSLGNDTSLEESKRRFWEKDRLIEVKRKWTRDETVPAKRSIDLHSRVNEKLASRLGRKFAIEETRQWEYESVSNDGNVKISVLLLRESDEIDFVNCVIVRLIEGGKEMRIDHFNSKVCCWENFVISIKIHSIEPFVWERGIGV